MVSFPRSGKDMSIMVAGAGPGNINFLTAEVLSAIQQAETVACFERLASDLKSVRRDIITIKTMEDVLQTVNAKNDVLILASGDPCFFGITEFLKNKGVKIDRVLTGISSMQYFMSRLQKQWQTIRFYSFHGRTFDFSKIKEERLFCILTDKVNNPDFISQILKKENISGKLYVGYNLSYNDELIETYTIGEKIKVKSELNVVLAERES